MSDEHFSLPLTDEGVNVDAAANLVMMEQTLAGAEDVTKGFGKYIPVLTEKGTTEYIWTNRSMRRMKAKSNAWMTKKRTTKERRRKLANIATKSREVNRYRGRDNKLTREV